MSGSHQTRSWRELDSNLGYGRERFRYYAVPSDSFSTSTSVRQTLSTSPVWDGSPTTSSTLPTRSTIRRLPSWPPIASPTVRTRGMACVGRLFVRPGALRPRAKDQPASLLAVRPPLAPAYPFRAEQGRGQQFGAPRGV